MLPVGWRAVHSISCGHWLRLRNATFRRRPYDSSGKLLQGAGPVTVSMDLGATMAGLSDDLLVSLPILAA